METNDQKSYSSSATKAKKSSSKQTDFRPVPIEFHSFIKLEGKNFENQGRSRLRRLLAKKYQEFLRNRGSHVQVGSSRLTLLGQGDFTGLRRRRRSDESALGGGPIKKAARGFFDMDEKFTKKDKLLRRCLVLIAGSNSLEDKTRGFIGILALYIAKKMSVMQFEAKVNLDCLENVEQAGLGTLI